MELAMKYPALEKYLARLNDTVKDESRVWLDAEGRAQGSISIPRLPRHSSRYEFLAAPTRLTPVLWRTKVSPAAMPRMTTACIYGACWIRLPAMTNRSRSTGSAEYCIRLIFIVRRMTLSACI